MANHEALWISGRLHPGEKILASTQAHYTHRRISEVLKLEFSSVDSDEYGRMDPEALESRLRDGDEARSLSIRTSAACNLMVAVA